MENKPKKIEIDEWLYKGCFISKFIHPNLYGKYEVFKNNQQQTFIGRTIKFTEAKKLCEQNVCLDNYLLF